MYFHLLPGTLSYTPMKLVEARGSMQEAEASMEAPTNFNYKKKVSDRVRYDCCCPSLSQVLHQPSIIALQSTTDNQGQHLLKIARHQALLSPLFGA